MSGFSGGHFEVLLYHIIINDTTPFFHADLDAMTFLLHASRRFFAYPNRSPKILPGHDHELVSLGVRRLLQLCYWDLVLSARTEGGQNIHRCVYCDRPTKTTSHLRLPPNHHSLTANFL